MAYIVVQQSDTRFFLVYFCFLQDSVNRVLLQLLNKVDKTCISHWQRIMHVGPTSDRKVYLNVTMDSITIMTPLP